jgi:hypothetical protein
VLLLAGIGYVQGQLRRGVALEINRMEQPGLEQSVKIQPIEKSLPGVDADLAQFEKQFARAAAKWRPVGKKSRADE